MERIEFFIGTEKDQNNRTISADVRYYALEQGRRLLVETFGGFTESSITGGWKGPDGRVVIEAGIKYEVWTEDINTFPNITLPVARQLRVLWNQSALILAVNGKGHFISKEA